jgi:subtilisin family serine protease
MKQTKKKYAVLTLGVSFALAAIQVPLYSQTGLSATGLVRAQKPIPNQYIVVLKQQQSGPGLAPDFAATAKEIALQYGGQAGAVYQHALHGFHVQMPESQATALSKDPRVAFVETDSAIRAHTIETASSWGLDRVDQRLGTNGNYSYARTGEGVHAYVIDTGISLNNIDFSGRILNDAPDYVGDGRNGDDCNGHGTMVAGVIGGTVFGVAKRVTLHPVRVMNCSEQGNVANAIYAIDWVTAHAIRPAVVNLSFGTDGSPSPALDQAVQGAIAAGFTYTVAAGNAGVNVSYVSPGRVPEAITVASTGFTDAKSLFSNFGSLVDLFAPGEYIKSDWLNNYDYTTHGTSLSSAHVAGLVAQYLQMNPNTDPVTMRNEIVNQATKGVVTDTQGSPNNLLYVHFPETAVTIDGQEQYECVAVGTRECAYLIWDSGTVTVTVNGRNHSISYDASSKKVTVALALAASINSDPAVTATASGSTVTVVSRNFSCFTTTASSSTSKPTTFSPSFTATPGACQQ